MYSVAPFVECWSIIIICSSMKRLKIEEKMTCSYEKKRCNHQLEHFAGKQWETIRTWTKWKLIAMKCWKKCKQTERIICKEIGTPKEWFVCLSWTKIDDWLLLSYFTCGVLLCIMSLHLCRGYYCACVFVCCCLMSCMKISLVDNKTYPSKSAKSQQNWRWGCHNTAR